MKFVYLGRILAGGYETPMNNVKARNNNAVDRASAAADWLLLTRELLYTQTSAMSDGETRFIDSF